MSKHPIEYLANVAFDDWGDLSEDQIHEIKQHVQECRVCSGIVEREREQNPLIQRWSSVRHLWNN